jgi:chaperonin GroEL
MAKIIISGKEAHDKIRAGVKAVAGAVSVTIGPRGRNVALEKSYGGPTITNDGVSIAKEITLADPIENIGADVVKEVAQKTNDLAGDGTSTSAVLTGALVDSGFQHVDLGVNAMGIKIGMEKASEAVIEELKKMAIQIKDKEKIIQVATISAESDELGKIIAETIEKVGKDGVVTVEESQGTGLESELALGMSFDKGYVSPYMVTNKERMEAEAVDASILITDKKISSIQEVLPLIEKLAQGGKKELVIIAEDIDGEALTTFVLNKLRGTFSVLGIKAPGYGENKKDILEDIAVVTGGTLITDAVSLKLEDASLSHLGKASRVIAKKDATTIVGGKGKKGDIEARAQYLRTMAKDMVNKYEKTKHEERAAKLTGGVAVLRVGAVTESEMKYLKLKIEDAVNATKAAISEGIVPGGGVALVRAAEIVRTKGIKNTHKGWKSEFDIGVTLVLDACSAPLRLIAENAGRKDSMLVIHEVKQGKGNAGYDAATDQHVTDMIASGIIDPVKVTRSALMHAVSAVGVLLTTDVAIANIPEPKKDMGGGGMNDLY